jgi:hypothetical protein
VFKVASQPNPLDGRATTSMSETLKKAAHEPGV